MAETNDRNREQSVDGSETIGDGFRASPGGGGQGGGQGGGGQGGGGSKGGGSGRG